MLNLNNLTDFLFSFGITATFCERDTLGGKIIPCPLLLMNDRPTTRRSHPGYYTASNRITWSKRELPLLYEDLSYNEEEEVYPRVQDTALHEQVIISSGIYENSNNGPIKNKRYTG